MKGQLSSGRESLIVFIFVIAAAGIAYVFTRCSGARTPTPLSVPSGLPRST